MRLREHNESRLRWWLDGQLPDRLPSRVSPDMVLESRRLEGNTLLKTAARSRVDGFYSAKRAREEDPGASKGSWEERYARSDSLLLYLTDKYLRELIEKAPKREKARYYLIHSAFRHICLSENTAGGYVELEKQERLGKNNHTIRTVAKFARAGFNLILDELDRRHFRLEVDEDKRVKNKYEAAWQERRILTDQYGTYRRIAAKRQELLDSGMSKGEANAEVASMSEFDCSPRKVQVAVKWSQENPEEGKGWI